MKYELEMEQSFRKIMTDVLRTGWGDEEEILVYIDNKRYRIFKYYRHFDICNDKGQLILQLYVPGDVKGSTVESIGHDFNPNVHYPVGTIIKVKEA